MKSLDLIKICRVLQKENVRYLIAGGMAVVAHGYGRLTLDLDLIIDLSPENIRSAFKCLHSLGYLPAIPVTAAQFSDARLRKQWITKKGMSVLSFHSDKHPDTPVDIFVKDPFNFSKVYKTSCKEEISPGVSFWYVPIPDLIAMKKRAGRYKDLDDIVHLKQLQRIAQENG